MNLLLEVARELFAMFWADAGLCLGGLASVVVAGLAFHAGLIGATGAIVCLVGGVVLTLAANVALAGRRFARREKR